MRAGVLILAIVMALPGSLSAGDANRLTYLDDFCNPYYAHRDFPKLTTPQWIAEHGVQAVVTLGIDDMRSVDDYETYLRPILTALKQIDGRAPVSIMTCTIDPAHPHLQTWINEGVSIETHTIDHPCPCLQGGSLEKAKSTYDRCVDLIASIPGNQPVAFRFPCCDSLNTPSPRAFTEIISKTTPAGNFLQLSSSVANLFTADDPQLPRELALNADGRPRFSRYAPFPSFVNKIENYPYPFVINRLCWEFPIAVPDDWQGQHLQSPNNPQTVTDMKALIDAAVIKGGTANIVFHPYDWIRSEQIVEVINHGVQKHGRQVKFLNFQECVSQLNHHLLAGQPLRDSQGRDNGVRLLDLNDDGFLDVVIGNAEMRRTRLWIPETNSWKEFDFPVSIVHPHPTRTHRDAGVRFGVIRRQWTTSFYVANEQTVGIWHFTGDGWMKDSQLLDGLALQQQPIASSHAGKDRGVRLRDLDRDGFCEFIVSNDQHQAVFTLEQRSGKWKPTPFTLPATATIVDAQGRDQGLRFYDIDEDGYDDVLFSNERSFGLYLFDSMSTGWSRKISDSPRGSGTPIPMISRTGLNNGAWFAARHLWVQNERTQQLPDGVDRMSFSDMLGMQPARPKPPHVSLTNIEVPEGFQVQLVAAEPLVMDPVAMDWGADGCLWVVEMADYPLGIAGQSQPGGRVRCLQDVDRDGIYDRSTLWIDHLSTPTGIIAWRQGVLISAAPDILYVEDTDGDGQADHQEVLYTGFNQGNQQHRVNGFCWGLDNWLYLANGDSGGVIVSKKTGQQVDIQGRDVRIRPDEGLIEAVEGQTQFGRSRDDWGNWFGCNNPNPALHYVLADRYLKRNPHFAPPPSRRDIRDGSNSVFPISQNISHCNPDFRPLGAPPTFTSANSIIVYRHTLFGPAYANTTFTSEPVYNIVHRRCLVPEGVTFRSVRPQPDASSEFFRSSDAWCRPTCLRVGPDGALYIVDMYREVIEHPEWIDDELEKTIDLRAGHDRGRIYRVAPVGAPPRPAPQFDQLATADLVQRLANPSGWQRDLAQRLLLWRNDPHSTELLKQMATNHPQPLARLHALCTLDGMQKLDAQFLSQMLVDADTRVRRHAIRLCEPFLNQKGHPLAEQFRAQQAVDDPQLQLQLAYSAGAWQDVAAAGRLLAQLALQRADDPYQRAAVMSSLNASNITATTNAVIQHATDQPAHRQWIERLLAMSVALNQKQLALQTFSWLTRTDDDSFTADHFHSLTRLLDALQDQPLNDYLDPAASARVDQMFSQARDSAIDDTRKDDRRLAAISLLGREPSQWDTDLDHLLGLLAPRHAPAIHTAALNGLARQADDRIHRLLLADWNHYAPSLRERVFELLLSRESGTQALLEAMQTNPQIASHLNAASRQRLLTHNQPEIRELAQQRLASPALSDRATIVTQFRNALDLPPDVVHGKAVFEKRCAACHQLENIGHVVGPNLTAIKDRSPLAMLTALLDPNRAVEDKYLGYQVLTIQGRLFNGIIVEEGDNHLVLRDQNGKQQEILRQHIDELRVTGKSLMPEGLEKDLTKQDLADLIEYVSGVSPEK